jgi:ABC-type transport system involved in multi-copper enzyme maturation permease subunit
MAMQMLYIHWKTVRLGLVPLVIAAFGLPLLTLRGAGRPEGITDGFYASFLLETSRMWLPFFPVVAATIGVTLALSAWSWDHQGGHVYALSLPVTRARYTLLKFGGGAALALIPAGAVLVGSLVATSSISLPVGLQAYPVAVATRFFLSTLLVYSMMFALAAGTIRTAVIVLSAWVVLLIAGDLILQVAAVLLDRPELRFTSAVQLIYQRLTEWPGPFHVLAGNWSLIDV